jgi:type IV secretory pathway VirB3-like protein
MKYYYPDNLEAPAMCGLWKIKDLIIISSSLILMTMLAIRIFSLIPLVPVALYTVMTITCPNGCSILSLLIIMSRYLITQQQIYFWK